MDSDSILHLEHPNKAASMVSTASWLKYDQVAVPRILDLYKKHELRQTFFVPAWCIEKYPRTVEAMLEGGHEIAHHGYLHEEPNKLSADEEQYWFKRGIDVIETFTGQKPRGFRSPSYNFSENTARFLGEEGFLYDSSLMADDVPYLIDGSAGEVVELPTHWALDDWPHYTHMPDLHYVMPISSPDRAMEVFISEFDAAWEYGGMWVSVWHPFVSGRLARCSRIDSMIQYMKDKGNVWFATLEEIATHVRQCIDDGSYKPRVDSLPYYDGPIPELTQYKKGVS